MNLQETHRQLKEDRCRWEEGKEEGFSIQDVAPIIDELQRWVQILPQAGRVQSFHFSSVLLDVCKYYKNREMRLEEWPFFLEDRLSLVEVRDSLLDYRYRPSIRKFLDSLWIMFEYFESHVYDERDSALAACLGQVDLTIRITECILADCFYAATAGACWETRR